MARPKVPLISRRRVLETALAIIDEDGLEGLSIRRLADALGVNGASLYHHFENKYEILIGATEFALSEVRTPDSTDEDWRQWLPRNAGNLRTTLLAHPALVPLIVGKRSLGMGAHMLDTSAARLVEEGVPSAGQGDVRAGTHLRRNLRSGHHEHPGRDRRSGDGATGALVACRNRLGLPPPRIGGLHQPAHRGPGTYCSGRHSARTTG